MKPFILPELYLILSWGIIHLKSVTLNQSVLVTHNWLKETFWSQNYISTRTIFDLELRYNSFEINDLEKSVLVTGWRKFLQPSILPELVKLSFWSHLTEPSMLDFLDSQESRNLVRSSEISWDLDQVHIPIYNRKKIVELVSNCSCQCCGLFSMNSWLQIIWKFTNFCFQS